MNPTPDPDEMPADYDSPGKPKLWKLTLVFDHTIAPGSTEPVPPMVR